MIKSVEIDGREYKIETRTMHGKWLVLVNDEVKIQWCWAGKYYFSSTTTDNEKAAIKLATDTSNTVETTIELATDKQLALLDKLWISNLELMARFTHPDDFRKLTKSQASSVISAVLDNNDII